jgi:DNA-binding LytR/AlgR family response regulator
VILVGAAPDGESARRLIRTERPDLALLDVRMPGASGVELAEELQGPGAPAVIFVTAYSRHATRAFELAVVDYVLKPLDFDRLAEAVERARTRIFARERAGRIAELEAAMQALRADQADGAPDQPLSELWVADRNGRIRIALEDVVWFEAEREYVRIHTPSRSFLVRRSIRDLAERLDPRRFQRLHRSALVNTSKITRIARRDGGGLAAVLADGAEVPVGRTFQEALRTRLRS